MHRHLAVLALVTTTACGGLRPVSGSPESLAAHADAETLVVNPIDYTGLIVGNKTESSYLSQNKKGRADAIEGWESAKTHMYPRRFADLFDKYGPKGVDLVAGDATDGLHIQIHVVRIEPGYEAYVMRQNAEVNMQVAFYDRSDMLATYELQCEGVGVSVFDNTEQTHRISEGFARCGKKMGVALSKLWEE